MQSTLLALLLTATTLASNAAAAPARIDELLQQEKWAEALPLLEQAVAATPADAEAHFRLGSARLHHGDLKEALAALAQATALAPTNSEYFRLLAAVYGNSAQQAGLLAKMGLTRKFVAAINRSIAFDPANLAARLALLEFARQAPGIVGGGMDKAYAQAAEIKQLDPTQGRRAYASLYLSEKRYPEALAAHEEILRDSPEDYGALHAVGRIAALSGARPERGIECLRRYKRPYKTHVGIRLRDRDTARSRRCTGPLYYLEFDARGMRLGAGVKEFDAPTLAAYRGRLARGLGVAALGSALTAATDAGAVVISPQTAQAPAGQRDLPCAGLLRWKGLFVLREMPLPPAFGRPAFVDYCAERLRPFAPLFAELRRGALAAAAPDRPSPPGQDPGRLPPGGAGRSGKISRP